MNTCKVIGITGGVGSGKTLVVSRAVELYHIPIILADEVGHIALEPGRATYDEVVREFGRDIVGSDGTVDRRILGAIVFAQEERRRRLNQIVHPFITQYIRKEIAAYARDEENKMVLLEAAILLESELAGLCDEIWLVTADSETRRRRLKASRGYSDDKINQMMKAQPCEDEIRRYVDKVITNNGGIPEIDRQLCMLLKP